MEKIVTIMTFITNANGGGPGHTALAVDDAVYSFEDIGALFDPRRSSWKRLDYDAYMYANRWRPVVLQTLNRKVLGGQVEAYIFGSENKFDHYIPEGVCSSQAAKAVNAGTAVGFNPEKFMRVAPTPHKVYREARNQGLVAAENVIWLDQSSMTVLIWSSIMNIINADYPSVAKIIEVTR